MTKLSVKEFLDSIGDWTAIELAEAIKGLEEKFGIKPQAQVLTGAVVQPSTVSSKQEEEKTEFNVILQSFPEDKKIPVIKAVRELTSLSLKEAKELVESIPKPIKENIPKSQAQEIKAKLEQSGAKVEIQ